MDIRFECPHCKQRIAIDDSAAGLEINCPGCQVLVTIPALAQVPQAAAPRPAAPQAPASQSGGSMQPVKPGGRALPRLRAEPEPSAAPAPELAPPVAALGKPGKGGKAAKGTQYRCVNPNCGMISSESQVLTQMVAGKVSKVCLKCRGAVVEMAPPPGFWARMMGKK